MRGPTGSARSIGSRIAALRFTRSVDQLTHSGCSEPAVRIGEGGEASDLSDPEFDEPASVAWLPPFAWRLDQVVDELRRESSWVRRLPSEYLREHVRVSTQPIETSPKREQLIDALNGLEGIEDMLVFASDYPHWDNDTPTWLARRLPDSWGRKVLHDNARDTLRLPMAVPALRTNCEPAKITAPLATPESVGPLMP